jgi:UDP-N-acetylmuramoylalanine--D-glutamate ligase
MDWQNKRVAVLGLGKSGLAIAKVLAAKGARVIASDSRTREELQEVAAALPEGVDLEAGSHANACLEADLIVVSPGVPGSLPVLQAAEADGVEVIGEIELAYRLAEAGPAAPIVAITGTNGKTTTTTLVGEIFKAAGLNAPVGGNIGHPLVLLAEEPVDWLIAEVSSFQLETVHQFRPHIAAWLNFTDDHLNRHGTREAYFAAKKRIFAQQTPEDWAVLNADDPALSALIDGLTARVLPFSLSGTIAQGIVISDGWIVWRQDGDEVPVAPIADIQLRGEHNLENCLAATAMALAAGIAPGTIAHALREFRAVEHRIEPVAVIDGAQWYNDSKGTNYDSTIKAIESFNEPLVLIAGGRDKGGAITPMIDAIARRVSHTVLIGEAAPYFERVLRAAGYEAITMAADLPAALQAARAQAVAGGVVLFSPACASFDMFRNYEERGRLFKEQVRDLAVAPVDEVPTQA